MLNMSKERGNCGRVRGGRRTKLEGVGLGEREGGYVEEGS